MKKERLYIIISFLGVFILHIAYTVNKNTQLYKNWAQMHDANFLSMYFQKFDFFIGLSYALAIGFTVYAFLRFMALNKQCVEGVIGGITLTGILYFLGCFLIGCCGSPMLIIYIGVFGSSVAGFTKPLVFIFTLITVTAGYFWIKKKAKCSTECNLIKNN